jgi:hypothetical protein
MLDLPDIVVSFAVIDHDGETVHTGSYRLRDNNERRAFGTRCHQAIADGFEIRTWRSDRQTSNARN